MESWSSLFLGITTLSMSQVSEMAKDLDAHVEEFRTRRLDDAGPFTFVAADALVLKVCEGGRVVGVHALVATRTATPLGAPTNLAESVDGLFGGCDQDAALVVVAPDGVPVGAGDDDHLRGAVGGVQPVAVDIGGVVLDW